MKNKTIAYWLFGLMAVSTGFEAFSVSEDSPAYLLLGIALIVGIIVAAIRLQNLPDSVRKD